MSDFDPGASPLAVVSSPTIDSFFDKLKQRFDLILVDSPPATTSAVGLVLARKVDGIVLVVEADHTRASVVQSVKHRIAQVGGHILGIVLNKRRYYVPSFIYKRL